MPRTGPWRWADNLQIIFLNPHYRISSTCCAALLCETVLTASYHGLYVKQQGTHCLAKNCNKEGMVHFRQCTTACHPLYSLLPVLSIRGWRAKKKRKKKKNQVIKPVWLVGWQCCGQSAVLVCNIGVFFRFSRVHELRRKENVEGVFNCRYFWCYIC